MKPRPVRTPDTRKNDAARIAELLDAIQILRDGITSIEAGRHYAAIPIGGQLRALLTERNKQSPPLLKQLIDTYHPDARIFACRFATFDAPAMADSQQLRMPGINATYQREEPGQKEISIPALLDLVVLQTRENVYRVRDVIEHVANRAGGAHYALHVNERFNKDMTICIVGGVPFWIRAMHEIGNSVLHIARHLLAELLTLQLSVGLVIRALPQRASMTIVRARNPLQLTSWSLGISEEQKLWLCVVDATGSTAKVSSDEPVDWQAPCYVAFSADLSNDLSTALRLFVNGICVGETIAPKPLFIYNNPAVYEIEINGHEDPGAFGCYDIRMWKNESIDSIVREDANAYAAIAQSKEGRCFFLPRNGTGVKRVGQSSFEFRNHIPSLIREVVARDFEWFTPSTLGEIAADGGTLGVSPVQPVAKHA
ncbi:MAG: hypothetical protein KF688_11925 [Pirellulales bacterium]|nr:hypothetical protein [Pirellulales bacterium]